MIEIQSIPETILQFLPKFGIAVFILFLFFMISWLLKLVIVKKVKPKTKKPLLAEFIGKIVAFIFVILGFVICLHILGFGGFAKHIVAGAGITTFIIGFAFKDIGENFLSGILMAFKSPFKIGDLIETNGITGYVYELDLRETSVKTLDGKDVFIPNAQIIKTPLNNFTIDGFLRYEIQIGIDYNANFEKVIGLVYAVLEQVPEVLKGEKKPVVVLDELLSSSVNMRIFYWINTFKSKSKTYHLHLKSKITIDLLKVLNSEGIYLPADILEVKNYDSQLLRVSPLK